MKKFIKWFSLFTILLILFAGCSNGSDPDPGTGPGTGGDVAVTSISLLIDGYTENNPYTLFEGDSVQLTAQVLPNNATNKNYTFEVTSGQSYVSLSNGTLTGIAEGTAIVKVTSSGKKADDTFATATFNFVITSDPEQITNVRLIVRNQNANTDPATTTTLPELNADNRYVIVNNEANAIVPGVRANVAGNTIVYINKPLKIQSEGEGAEATYTPYSISARVRLAGARTTGDQPVTGGNFGVTTGIFTNPAIAVTAATPLRFAGVRSAQSGQKRMYITRDGTNNDNSSASFASSNSWVDLEDTAAAKTQGFKEQEYIFKVERTTNSSYTLTMFSADGLTELAKNTRSATNVLADDLQSVNGYLYLGFIISSVTAEISDIVVKDGTEEVFKSPAATPYPQPILKVNVSATDPVGADAAYGYQCIYDSFPSAGVQLNGQVIPTDGTSLGITWSISSGTNGSVNANGLVTVTGGGAFTVKAQSTGEAFGEFKFNILSDAPSATAVTVTGATSVESGGEITLTASVTPPFAVQTVTWSVTAEDGTSPTTNATIDSGTGVLTAGTVAVETIVKVFAAATSNSSIKSSAHSVTIRPSGSGPQLPQIWQTDIQAGSRSVTQPSDKIAVSTDNSTLTMKGQGRVNGSDQTFNFVYLPITSDNFTMTVKVKSAVLSGNSNATRIGILAMVQSAVTQNSSNGALTDASAGFAFGGVGVRPNGANIVEWCTMRTTATGWGNGAAVTGLTGATTGGYTTVAETNFLLRLERVHDSTGGTNQIKGYLSTDNGLTWKSHEQTTANLDLQGDVYVGLFVGSNEDTLAGTASTVEFSDLRITGSNGTNVYTDQLVNFAWLK
jgi:hypothetical protein